MTENMMENKTKHDTVTIGFDKGGKTMAGALEAVGKKVILVEKSDKMYDGTCINVGCISTKLLVYRARSAVAKGGSFEEKTAAYRAAMEQKEDLTARFHGKNYQKLDSNPNITVTDETASFQSPHMMEMERDGRTFQAEGEQIFISTGSPALILPIEGSKRDSYIHASEDLLSLTELPSRLVIIGDGYIGAEFSSIYANFGSKVTILQDENMSPPREDEEIVGAVRESLESRGIRVVTGVKVRTLEQAGGRALTTVDNGREVQRLEAETILVVTERRPNTAGLNLEAVGVETGPGGGIVTDDSLITTASHIYAIGDVKGGLQSIYISLDDFRIVESKVLGDGSYTLEERGAVPYSIFLIPSFPRAGLSEREATERGYKVKMVRSAATAILKAQVLEQSAGLLKAVIDEETGLILGAHLFRQESYEVINMIKLAMGAKVPYQVPGDTIYTHPAISEAFSDLFAV